MQVITFKKYLKLNETLIKKNKKFKTKVSKILSTWLMNFMHKFNKVYMVLCLKINKLSQNINKIHITKKIKTKNK